MPIKDEIIEFEKNGRDLSDAICMYNDDVLLKSGGRSTIFAGGTGVGKTSFCFNLAFCIAAGKDFLGIFQPLKKFPTIYINNDQPRNDFEGRYFPTVIKMLGKKTIEKANDRFELVHLHNENRENGEGYVELIEEQINSKFAYLEDQNQPKTVFIDNHQRWFIEEISHSGSTAMKLTNELQRIAESNNVCFVIVTHLEKMGKKEPDISKIYGSSINCNFADSVILLYNPKNNPQSQTSILEFGKGELSQKFTLTKDKDNKIWKTPSIPVKKCKYFCNEFYRAKEISTKDLTIKLQTYFPELKNPRQIANAKKQLCRAGIMTCRGQTYYGCLLTSKFIPTDNEDDEAEGSILKEVNSTSQKVSQKVA